MTHQFVETIKIADGKPQALALHQERMERTIRHFFPSLTVMPQLQTLIIPRADMTLYKARVVYGEHGVENVEYAPYAMREIESLKVVVDNDIEYAYKSTDRSLLNTLTAKKGDSDDIIIVKRGLVTDTSFTNLAMYDGTQWLTPKHPLLHGTKRTALLQTDIIKEADITLKQLRQAQKVCLFNAMIDFGLLTVHCHNIDFT